MKRIKTVFQVMFTLGMFLFVFSMKAYALPEVTRLAGSDRYGTAVEISKAGWPDGSSENAVLATGEDFPDALCAAPLAAKLNAPILLTLGQSLDKRVEDELIRLGVKNVYIVGGVSAVSQEVEDQIWAKGINSIRIAGSDRYETPIKIAERLGTFDEIVIAPDSSFPDVLSIVPVAAKKHIPVILSPKDALPENVVDYLKSKDIKKAYIIGGAEVIDNYVVQQILGVQVQRIFGQDRYETNTKVIAEFASILNFNITYIAIGTNFPDALAGSAIAPLTSSPIILTDEVPSVITKNFVSLNYNSMGRFKVLGGEGAVPESTLKDLINVSPGDKFNDFSLRYGADFRVKVYNNVYWVPVNTLGKPILTAEEILSLPRDPEILKISINTLYDAVQYIRAVDFKASDDNVLIEESGYNWQHHKPGNKALTTNEGTYATISNLGNYLLKGNYDEVGFIHYFQKDGAEYVFNYIKFGGKYYIMDLTHYKNDLRYTSVETGNLKDYYESDYIAGNLHEAASLEDYIKYCAEKYNDPPELVTAYTSDNILPVAVKKTNSSSVTIYFPKSAKDSVKVIYDVKNDGVNLDFTDDPLQFPSWL